MVETAQEGFMELEMKVVRLLYYLPMESMTDYKPKEWQDLEELYRKQNLRICELEEENKKLKEENEELKEAMKELNNYNKFRIQENEKLKLDLELKNLALKQIQEWSILI